ncbi:hypothetical protein DL89DRAFT_259860 [Linderina pennispora]|uniref:Uncharacterized protein n=1 Tax=Linderina pennispora TaxID=61395 RepID=A0A1Y1VZN0_9FUNG|nr:uncharacterized protein DL89DRAFT_259860 [Linderina pennispora]ORX66728.1 hypothetical protein DL89DRAFT_259860 [Linderina pennispora]
MNFELATLVGAALLLVHTVAAATPLRPNLLEIGDLLSDSRNTNALASAVGRFNGRSSTNCVWNGCTAKLLDLNLINKIYGQYVHGVIQQMGCIENTRGKKKQYGM